MPFKHRTVLTRSRILLLILVTSCMLMFSCKKAIEKAQENLILDAVTDGRWYVQLYTQQATDLTSNFAAYEFQFYRDGTVDGISNTDTKKGTWSSDISNYTITATFPPVASDTLKLLNHTWKITDSYTNYVEAKTATATGDNILHLRKK